MKAEGFGPAILLVFTVVMLAVMLAMAAVLAMRGNSSRMQFEGRAELRIARIETAGVNHMPSNHFKELLTV